MIMFCGNKSNVTSISKRGRKCDTEGVTLMIRGVVALEAEAIVVMCSFFPAFVRSLD